MNTVICIKMKTFTILFILMYSAFAGWDCASAQVATSANGKWTIHLYSGKKSPIDSIWKIGNESVEYVYNGSLHDYKIDQISRITQGEQNYIIVSDTLYPLIYINMVRARQNFDSTWCQDPGMNYKAMGAAHAEMYVTPTGGFFAGMLLAPTVVFPVAVAMTPPRGGDDLIPNKTVYKSVPEYREAYTKRGHKIKITGVLIGVGAFVLTAGTIALATSSLSFE